MTFANLSTGFEWIRRLAIPDPVVAREWGLWSLHYKGREGPVLWSDDGGGSPLVMSLGYGSSVRDYARLAQFFQRDHRVYRIGHPGSDRRAALNSLISFGVSRWWRRYSSKQAAQQVRARIHAPEIRALRLAQLEVAVRAILSKTGDRSISLAGHSYGTDTVLEFASRHGKYLKIDNLYLFSPHPPGYLIAESTYRRLAVENILVVTGTRDWTRDGVGPMDRLRVMEFLGPRAQSVVLKGVGHMDFAFSDLGPKDWPERLRSSLASPH